MNRSLHVHPFYIILALTVVTFLFGFWGLSEVKGWKTLLRSAITILLTLGLSALILVVIFLANLFKFT